MLRRGMKADLAQMKAKIIQRFVWAIGFQTLLILGGIIALMPISRPCRPFHSRASGVTAL